MEHKSHGGNELVQSFKDKLQNDIHENFQHYQQENEKKRKFTEVSPIKTIANFVNYASQM